MRRVVVVSAATEAAAVLREEILRHVQGAEWLIGGENEVIGMLGVSRPTFRQALRILEQEQLVTVRRGVGGGLFAKRPTEDGVAQTASVFLRSEGTSYGDLIQTLSLLSSHCARLAAEHSDQAERGRLGSYYTEALGELDPTTIAGTDFVRLAGGWFRELALLARSSTLHLFVSVLIELARPAAGSQLYTPQRVMETIDRHTGVAEAIKRGSPALAARRLTEHFELIVQWTDASIQLGALYPPVERRFAPYERNGSGFGG
jgi:GntR family transcriptional repressor for pyruvate dehydrogenase complex